MLDLIGVAIVCLIVLLIWMTQQFVRSFRRHDHLRAEKSARWIATHHETDSITQVVVELTASAGDDSWVLERQLVGSVSAQAKDWDGEFLHLMGEAERRAYQLQSQRSISS